jgi:hypothetical protein
MDEFWESFYRWLKAETYPEAEGTETFDQGYRQGYRNAVQDVVDEFEERAFAAGVDLEE